MVALTSHGEEVFARAERDARAVGRELLAGFDATGRAQLKDLFTRFIEE